MLLHPQNKISYLGATHTLNSSLQLFLEFMSYLFGPFELLKFEKFVSM